MENSTFSPGLCIGSCVFIICCQFISECIHIFIVKFNSILYIKVEQPFLYTYLTSGVLHSKVKDNAQRRLRDRTSAKLRLLLEQGKQLKTERQFHVSFPKVEAHRGHSVGQVWFAVLVRIPYIIMST